MAEMMDNYDKARKIAYEIVRLDYGGNLEQFQNECGYIEGFIQDVFFWLEDGNGDGCSVDECRLLYEL